MEEKELWMNKLKEKLGGLLGAASCFRLGTTGKKNLCLLWRGRYILIVNGR